MAFVRISLVTPKRGQEQRVEELLQQLMDFCRSREGFVAGYQLKSEEHGSPRLGRITIWASREHANRTAMEQQDISLQSELHLVVEEATHDEHAFEGSPAT